MRLTIRTAMWRAHVARVASGVEGLVPVVKGNGYGFGRNWLAAMAAEFCDTVAVGTVHELDGLPAGLTAVVLTPTLAAPNADEWSSDSILSVGHPEHIAALEGWRGRVIVKLVSEMRRYGGGIELIDAARSAGLDVVGVSVHPPLVGGADHHVRTIVDRLDGVDTDLAVWLSHLDPQSYASLPRTHTYRLRLGTLLWHGDKSALALSADVLDVRPVRAGEVAGYRLGPIEQDGHLVMIGAGTANGIDLVDTIGGSGAGRGSPFHFGRQRIRLHEAPHMHTSMGFVPLGAPLPSIGDRVDVQRAIHTTMVDEYEWL